MQDEKRIRITNVWSKAKIIKDVILQCLIEDEDGKIKKIKKDNVTSLGDIFFKSRHEISIKIKNFYEKTLISSTTNSWFVVTCTFILSIYC